MLLRKVLTYLWPAPKAIDVTAVTGALGFAREPVPYGVALPCNAAYITGCYVSSGGRHRVLLVRGTSQVWWQDAKNNEWWVNLENYGRAVVEAAKRGV